MKTGIHYRLFFLGLCAAVVALGQVQAKFVSKLVEDYSLGVEFLSEEYVRLSVATVKNNDTFLPVSFDWKHKLPPAKDQGMASVSWIFATVAATEAVHSIHNSSLEEPVRLSEQEVIDCQNVPISPYCKNNWLRRSVFLAASYVKQSGVLPEELYPYQARLNLESNKLGDCLLSEITENRVKIGEFLRPPIDESLNRNKPVPELTLMRILHQYGPVIGHIAVDQEKTEFNYSYTGETVITENPYVDPNHAVLIVGWGEDPTSGQKYWLVRNSWGRHWGHYGYAKIARGSNAMRLEEFVVIPTPPNNESILDKMEPSSFNFQKPYYATGLHDTPETRKQFLTIPIALDDTRQEFIAAKEWDWRKQGKVSPIKDQKSCGSCWAFAVIEALESAIAIHANQSTVPELSPQQLLDCSYDFTNDPTGFESNLNACCGGLPWDAFAYTMKYGITTEEAYPYEWALRKCQKAEGPVYKNSGFMRAQPISSSDSKTSDEEIMRLVQTYGPVVACIVTDHLADYTGGIIDQPRNTRGYNHAVVIVGWGTSDSGVDYWIVRNSWGEKWGEKGYFRVLRGTNNNVLNINEAVVAPIV